MAADADHDGPDSDSDGPDGGAEPPGPASGRTRVAGVLRAGMGVNGVTAHADVGADAIVCHGARHARELRRDDPALRLTPDGFTYDGPAPEGMAAGLFEFSAWRTHHWRKVLAEHGWPDPRAAG